MWAGVVVMGALFLYLLARGPRNPAPAPAEGAAAAGAVASR